MKEVYKRILTTEYEMEIEEVNEMSENEMENFLYEDFQTSLLEIYGNIFNYCNCFYHYDDYLISKPYTNYDLRKYQQGIEVAPHAHDDFLDELEKANEDYCIFNDNMAKILKNTINMGYALGKLYDLSFYGGARNEKNIDKYFDELENKYDENIRILVDEINIQVSNNNFYDWLRSFDSFMAA